MSFSTNLERPLPKIWRGNVCNTVINGFCNYPLGTTNEISFMENYIPLESLRLLLSLPEEPLAHTYPVYRFGIMEMKYISAFHVCTFMLRILRYLPPIHKITTLIIYFITCHLIYGSIIHLILNCGSLVRLQSYITPSTILLHETNLAMMIQRMVRM